jgi:predicted nucleotidyltransferase
MKNDGPGELLFGRTRRAVLALLLTHPDESFHLRDIQRRTGASIAPLHAELAKLSAAGLVEREQRGRQVFFTANRRSSIFPELRSLLIKTAGVADVLRSALATAGLSRPPRVVAAFVFGSMARADPGAASDVDVMVIGSVTFAEVAHALHEVQATLGREVNPSVYTLAEWRAKLRAGHPFLSRVVAEPKVFLIGDEHEFAAMAGQRLDQAARPHARRDRQPLRRRRTRSARLQGERD